MLDSIDRIISQVTPPKPLLVKAEGLDEILENIDIVPLSEADKRRFKIR